MFKRTAIFGVLFLVISQIVFGINNSINSEYHDISAINVSANENNDTLTAPVSDEPFLFAALPSYDKQLKTSVKTADARAEIIRQYLQKYKSPLEPYSELIVELSDQYNFDYRWLPAIAQQESNLCHRIPENSYNCWGWGIYPEPSNPSVLKVTRFDNYEDALRRIAPQFTKIFLKGNHTKDPMEVMKTYTPPSDGSWANGVSTFFDSLD